MEIIFLGIGEFGDIVLNKLRKAGYDPVSCRLEDIERIKPDLVIVANFGRIIPKDILDIPRFGCLNLHPSLLPKYRGSSPIQTPILNGDKETGVTIFLMDAKVDHGPILAQKKTAIGENETSLELFERLALMGADLLIDTIPDWLRGEIKLRRQNEAKATYTKKLSREQGQINWRKSARNIERQVRAFHPWPGTYTFYKPRTFCGLRSAQRRKCPQKVRGKGKRLKILKARLEKNKLVVEEVQLEGKKPMPFKDFLRGHLDYDIPQRVKKGSKNNS